MTAVPDTGPAERAESGPSQADANADGNAGRDARRPDLRRDLSMSAVLAGAIAVVVSFSGPFVIVLSAAGNGHLTAAQTGSWVWAISIGSGLTCLLLSWRTRIPVITAWSTPGAALLVTGLKDYPYKEAIGAYLICGIALAVVGISGVFGKLMRRIPQPVVAAMLAGILFSFGTGAFSSLPSAPWIAGTVLATYLVVKRRAPRYAVLAALAGGVIASAATSRLDARLGQAGLAHPVLTTPAFSAKALVGIAVPLFIATLASQNAPGIGVLKTSGYTADDRLLIGSTGAVSTVLAPFGSHAINLAAITAAICTGPDSHPDPRRRYVAGMSCGFFYLLVGTFGSTLVALFAGLPPQLVAALAGVALFGALSGALTGAMLEERNREAALVAFLVTASGVTLAGIGSAFWGLVFGMATHAVLTARTAKAAG